MCVRVATTMIASAPDAMTNRIAENSSGGALSPPSFPAIHPPLQASATPNAASGVGTDRRTVSGARSRAFRINVLVTATLLAALEQHPNTRMVLASSADVYGAPHRMPVDEDTPVRPANVYAATKVAAEALARELAARHGAPVVILRPANQNGPRQHPGLAASAFAKQIADAEAGLSEPVVRHGRLDAERDFLDVRDMARAYAAALGLAESGTFNVGTGRAVAIAEILDILIALARIPVRAELDPSRVRGGEPTRLALDTTIFRQKTGWSPRIPLADSPP